MIDSRYDDKTMALAAYLKLYPDQKSDITADYRRDQKSIINKAINTLRYTDIDTIQALASKYHANPNSVSEVEIIDTNESSNQISNEIDNRQVDIVQPDFAVTQTHARVHQALSRVWNEILSRDLQYVQMRDITALLKTLHDIYRLETGQSTSNVDTAIKVLYESRV